jgi:hypothetical protein
MRRLLVLASIVLACAATRPVSAESIVDRTPMDLGTNQTGTLNDMSQDLLMPRHQQTWWFDAGVSYPVGTLHKSQIRPGFLARVNHQIWERDALGIVGSVGVLLGNDSYANDIQNDAAFNAPIVTPFGYSGLDITSRYFMATPMTLELQVMPPVSGTVRPFFSLGPGAIWSHENITTSAVNAGVGSVSLGDTTGVLIIGQGGEQGISPYGIRTRTQFNIGWNARAGVGFRLSGGENPLWMRLVASGTTYYEHTAPRTVLGFATSFSH